MGTRRDIDEVIQEVRRRLPGVKCEQLKTKHPLDDRGLWFFDLPETKRTVQVQSWNGMCPFLIEGDDASHRGESDDIRETVEFVVIWLGGQQQS